MINLIPQFILISLFGFSSSYLEFKFSIIPASVKYDSNSLPIISQKHVKIYGPLQLQISDVKIKDNSLIVKGYNRKGQPLYIAVNCLRKQINSTGESLNWKGWENPKYQFEFVIIEELCKNKPLYN
tara:strand:- start:957 stop:1334 length:378 start_codon:yes stop_codon:yes gene_type:complete